MINFCQNMKEPCLQLKKQRKKKRQNQWKEKQFHGKFLSETKEVRREETWEWIRKGYLEKVTEGLIFNRCG